MGITGFSLFFLCPGLILMDTTPTGGDTASHVYTAWYLKTSLLPEARLSGWCMGNLGGFPLLENYFPLPFLAITLLSRIVPLNVAFKAISILGVLTLPWAVRFFLRCLNRPAGVRMAGALISLVFLFNEGQSIWGGNILSSLSGTFCYALGFSLALVFLGCLYRHFHGRPCAISCSLILALTGFCHGYALLFAGFGSLYFLFYRRRFTHHLKKLMLIHGLSVGIMAFWLFPLISHLPWTTAFSFSWHFENPRQALMQVFPLLTLPVVFLSVFAILGLSINPERDKTAALFVGYLAINGFLLYAIGHRLNLVDVRFLPFFQMFFLLMAAFAFERTNRSERRSTLFLYVYHTL